MAVSDTFHCRVITPEEAVLEADATLAVFPAHDGQVGVLRGRAPLLCKLGAGVLRLETAEGPQRLFVDGGFAQVDDRGVVFLTEHALPPEELDAEQAREALQQAARKPATTDEQLEERLWAQDRARARLRAATRD